MNLGDVKTRVKRQFGDESGVQVTDGDIVRWVNDAQRDIVNQNEGILEKITTADAVLGQQDYTEPTDLFVLHSITYKRSADERGYFRLQYLSLQDFNQYVDGWDGSFYANSRPQIYTRFGGTLKFFPIPDASFVGAIKLYYQRRPVDVANDGDTLDLPEQYHNAVVNYCLGQAYELDEDWDSSGNKFQQMTADVTSNREREKWVAQETYPIIGVRPEDQDDWYGVG